MVSLNVIRSVHTNTHMYWSFKGGGLKLEGSLRGGTTVFHFFFGKALSKLQLESIFQLAIICKDKG